MTGSMDAKVLRRAAELVEQGWRRGSVARDAMGRTVTPDSPHAESWCLLGALGRAQGEIKGARVTDYSSVGTPEYDAVLQTLGADSVLGFNDAPERTADEVAAVLRQAAERCEHEEN